MRTWLFAFPALFVAAELASARDYNELILREAMTMPEGGSYAAYRKDLPEARRFDDLYEAVASLDRSLGMDPKGRLRVKPARAADFSFCSSATYLLFCKVVESLQKEGVVSSDRALSRELARVGDKRDVIHGKLDGVGLFGHWNADGPGTAVLFERLNLGRNFSSLERAKPGDFLKIFWNDAIGKGERGHLVLYLGESEDGKALQVWSSNLSNSDGSNGYGTMTVEKSRIARALFSRLEHPENLANWLGLSETERTSDYLVRILRTGSSEEEMKAATGAVD
ncbi:MAG: hypothetical protein WD342_11890 [Verrucomicrobiales bacterium]